MKICKRCNIEKEISSFRKNKNICKICTSLQMKLYNDNHKNEINIYQKEYNENHKDEIKEKQKIYNRINKNKISDYQKQYKIDNILTITEYQKLYQKEYKIINKDKVNKNQKKSYNKKKNDMNFRLHKSISSAIYSYLKYYKNNESVLKYLEYNINDLKLYLESLFESWMNWDNWGIYNSKTYDAYPTWNLDHIIPQSKLPYFSMNDENFKICWSLNNLRPYSSKQNVLDGNRR